MIFQTLADLVAILHFLFILFVLFGGLLVLRWRWLMWIHIPSAIWGTLIGIFRWYCPLTPLENWLRHVGGNEAYSTSFIEHYLVPIIYPSGLTRELQLTFAAIVLLINCSVYLWIWTRSRSKKN